MKEYTVWFIVKLNNRGYLHCRNVTASDKKQAWGMIEEFTMDTFGRHAFAKTTKAPEWAGGVPGDLERRNLYFNGMTYTGAYKYGKQIVLW